MSFRLTITQQAHADIKRNADWWANRHSTEQAIKWANTVYDQIETLRGFPESHALSTENDLFSFEIRDKLVGLGSRPSYRAIFTIKGHEVFVLMVRAAQEDGIVPADINQ